MITPLPDSSRCLRAFTLIELLTVIAIIGILSAITIPVVSSVRDASTKTKTKVQFSQWSAGIRLFKNAYGYYPQFTTGAAGDRHKVNGSLAHNDATIAGDDYLFRELLTGKGAVPAVGGGFTFGSSESVLATAQNKKKAAVCHV